MSMGGDEEATVDRVLEGDTAAFAVLVARWQGPMVNLAYRFCRDHARAEDLAQEAFLRAFRRLGSWRRDAAFSTWLFALATNVYRDELRRVAPDTVAIEEGMAATGSAEEVIGDADRRALVQRAVQSLPSKYREPLVLFYFHEQDVAATAASLGLPAGTVKARLSRGRDLLASKLRSRI